MTTKLKVFFNYFLRAAILVVSFIFLYVQFRKKVSSEGFFNQLFSISDEKGVVYILISVLMLMIINWGLEILKWRILTQRFTKLKFSHCIKGVISGITISMFLPNRMGDVAGKILWLRPGSRWKGFFANIYASFSQIIATLFVSSFAMLYFFTLNIPDFSHEIMGTSVFALSIIILPLLLLAYFNLGFLSRLLQKIRTKWIVRISSNLGILNIFSIHTRLIILLISLIRFLIYCIQFYLLLRLFGFPIAFFEGIMIISVVYFFITVVPQFAIAEVATRGALTIFVFDLYGKSAGLPITGHEAILLLASTSLWLINLFIPAMAGLSMLPGLKRISNKTP